MGIPDTATWDPGSCCLVASFLEDSGSQTSVFSRTRCRAENMIPQSSDSAGEAGGCAFSYTFPGDADAVGHTHILRTTTLGQHFFTLAANRDQ